MAAIAPVRVVARRGSRVARRVRRIGSGGVGVQRVALRMVFVMGASGHLDIGTAPRMASAQ